MNHFLPLSVLIFSFFSFLAIAVWSENRRREREAFYKSEALKRIAEGTAGASAVDFLREQHRLDQRRRHEGIKIGGLVSTAVSLAFTVFLAAMTMERRPGLWTLGLIPLSMGIALLAYGYLPSRKEPPDGVAAGQ